MRADPVLSGYALGFVGVAIFAGTLPMTRLALQGFDLPLIILARAALASALAAGALVLWRVRPAKAALGPLFLAGLLLVFGFPGFSTLAMAQVPAAHGAVVLGLLPLLTAAFAALVGGERPTAVFWGWALAGAGLVLTFTLSGADLTPGPGDAWLVAAALSASFGYAISGRLSRDLPGWAVIAWALVLTAPLSVGGTLWWLATHPLPAPGPGPLWAMAYLAALSMFGGFVFWNAGLARGGIAKVGQVQLLQSFITLALSALILGERVTPVMVGFALAVACVVWAGRKAVVRRRPLS